MRCVTCRRMMVGDGYELLDEGDYLSVRAWRCERCGDVTEEVRVWERGEAKRVVYAVRSWSVGAHA